MNVKDSFCIGKKKCPVTCVLSLLDIDISIDTFNSKKNKENLTKKKVHILTIYFEKYKTNHKDKKAALSITCGHF